MSNNDTIRNHLISITTTKQQQSNFVEYKNIPYSPAHNCPSHSLKLIFKNKKGTKKKKQKKEKEKKEEKEE